MNKKDNSSEYRKLASVDELLREAKAVALLKSYPRNVVVEALRQALTDARESITQGSSASDKDQLIDSAAAIAIANSKMSLRRAINATGVIIHTGLGRALLCDEARKALAEAASSHVTLEIDRETGKRGSRQDHVHDLLIELTGAEDALVVNNNAGAVFLAIKTIARNLEVIISRGQLVEIGGSFRLPDIIESAGAKLVEVGTTNRTRIKDYNNAITEDTGLILRCHPSNFKITGFTEEASLEELAALGEKAYIPVLDDLGSGAFIDMSQFGLAYEPTVQDSVKANVDLICFSGDKLLGGPQAGILVGKSELISQCRSNPIARALRIDKLSLAALGATLRVYRDGDPASSIPVLAAISRPLVQIKSQAQRLARKIDSIGIDGLETSVVNVDSEVGGGSLPGQSIESCAVSLKSSLVSADYLVECFRGNDPSIFGRVVRDSFLLDMRTVGPQEALDIISCVQNL